jgi:hypothetical protein
MEDIIRIVSYYNAIISLDADGALIYVLTKVIWSAITNVIIAPQIV